MWFDPWSKKPGVLKRFFFKLFLLPESALRGPSKLNSFFTVTLVRDSFTGKYCFIEQKSIFGLWKVKAFAFSKIVAHLC